MRCGRPIESFIDKLVVLGVAAEGELAAATVNRQIEKFRAEGAHSETELRALMTQPMTVEYNNGAQWSKEKHAYKSNLLALVDAIHHLSESRFVQLMDRVNDPKDPCKAFFDPEHIAEFREKLKLKQLQLRLLQLAVILEKAERAHPNDLSAAITAFLTDQGSRLQKLAYSGMDSRSGAVPSATELLDAAPRVAHLVCIEEGPIRAGLMTAIRAVAERENRMGTANSSADSAALDDDAARGREQAFNDELTRRLRERRTEINEAPGADGSLSAVRERFEDEIVQQMLREGWRRPGGSGSQR